MGVSGVGGGGSIEVRTAGTVRRLLAGLLDAVPLLTLLWLLAWQLVFPNGLPPSPWNPIDRTVDLIIDQPGAVMACVALAVGLLVLWHAIGEAALGGSPGKRALGLRVIDAWGRRPSLARATVHALLGVAGLALLLTGWLCGLVDPTRRTLYDRLAGVWVVGAVASIEVGLH